MLEYELGNHFSIETAIVAGELYRYGAEWALARLDLASRMGYEMGCRQ